MAHGKPRDPRKEQQWRRWIHQWQLSGLTVRDFCHRHRLSIPSFYAWRRSLRLRDATPFLPVQLLPDPLPAPDNTLELLLAGGRRLRVSPGFDPDTLRQLLAVLQEDAPC